MRLRTTSALPAILICLAACSDRTGPKLQPTRHYELVSVDGNPLPALARTEPTIMADSGTITLDSIGHSRTFTQISQPPNPYDPAETAAAVETPYLIRGDSIFLGALGHCRDVCIPDRAGNFTDSSLTIPDAGFPSDGRVYRYRRVVD